MGAEFLDGFSLEALCHGTDTRIVPRWARSGYAAPVDQTDERIRVLIVEDDDDIRALLRMNVEAHPDFCLAGEAPDGRHAAELLKLGEPDVVIMDLDMPHIDGIGAIQMIRRDHPDATVVVYSARYDKYDMNDLLSERANLYVDKSRPVDELFREIVQLVKRKA